MTGVSSPTAFQHGRAYGVTPDVSGGPFGFPDASNTGVPAGATLTPLSGEQHITTPDAVIDGVELTGFFLVDAPNVTIRNSRVISDNTDAVYIDDGASLLIEDCEIVIPSTKGYGGISPSNYTARRLNIHGGEGHFWVMNNVVIEDCYSHDPMAYDPETDPHVDNIQLNEPNPPGANNAVIDHNSILGSYDASSCLQMKGGTNIAITNNKFSGAGYSLRMAFSDGSTDLVVTGNRFSNEVPAHAGHPEQYAFYAAVDEGVEFATTWDDNKYLNGPNAGEDVAE